MNTATLFKRSERSEVMIYFNFKFKNNIFRQAWAPFYDHEKATKRPRNIKRCISLVNKIRRFITRVCQLKKFRQARIFCRSRLQNFVDRDS